MVYYIEQIKGSPKSLPLGVAMKVFIRDGANDCVAMAYIHEDGGIALWRKGSCLGTFDCLRDAYEKLEQTEKLPDAA